MRRVTAALIVVGLSLGVTLLWPRPTADQTVDPGAIGSTTTSSVVLTTTTTTGTTSTTGEESHVVDTVEEAEEILRELWFGWFEGIYNQDEERIREVVATQHQLDLAIEQFGSMEFTAEPTLSAISFNDTEILLATDDCTAIWTESTFTDFINGTTTDVHILRWNEDWRFFSLWAFRDDLWEADCESQLG